MDAAPVPPPTSTDSKPKKIVERSASYPNITFSIAWEFALSVQKHFPSNGQHITREDMAAVLKKTAASIQRDIAACVQYDLLERQKDKYAFSDLFRNLKNAFEKEKRRLWLQAFQSPKLYSDLITKFDGHVLPAELPTHLIRFHDIAEKAAPVAAQIFIENARYCGALNEHNILTFKQEYLKLSDPNFQFAEVVTEEKPVNNGNPVITEPITILPQAEAPVKQQPLLLEEINNEEKIKIPLTNRRFAYLIYPNDLTKKDINILRKQLEVLDELISE